MAVTRSRRAYKRAIGEVLIYSLICLLADYQVCHSTQPNMNKAILVCLLLAITFAAVTEVDAGGYGWHYPKVKVIKVIKPVVVKKFVPVYKHKG